MFFVEREASPARQICHQSIGAIYGCCGAIAEGSQAILRCR
jgi:hypothetical protein